MPYPIPTIDDDALVWRRVRVVEREVVFVRGILEASEGLACMFAEKGGDLMLVAPSSQVERLDEVIGDLCAEVGAIVTDRSAEDSVYLRVDERTGGNDVCCNDATGAF